MNTDYVKFTIKHSTWSQQVKGVEQRKLV